MSYSISFAGIFGTKKQPPPPRKRVHFEPFTLRHEYYDVELGKWMNFGKHPTVHKAQFPASVLIPHRKNNDSD